MATSFNFQQFNQNSENQEIINLQNSLASYERRLDELQKLAANSDAAAKMASLQTDINALQHQMDNVANSGKKEAKALLNTFNSLKASVAESIDILSEKIDNVYNDVQANTARDKRNECYMHLDKDRWQSAAAVADEMTTDAVIQLIQDYCNENKHRQDVKQALSEFINCIKDRTRRASYKHCLKHLWDYTAPVSHIQAEQQLFFGGTLLNDKQHQVKLNEFYGNVNQKWDLIYKAVEHGFSTANFHRQCDGQEPTMIIIQSKGGCLFGAFTKIVWSYKRGFKQDTASFLFTLTNPHGLPPTKFDIRKSNSDNAVYHSGAGYLGEPYDYYLFGFGGDGLNMLNFVEAFDGVSGLCRGDLFIAGDCNKNSCSSSRFPCSYIDTCGHGDKTFAGATHFTVSDIEVYILKQESSILKQESIFSQMGKNIVESILRNQKLRGHDHE